MEDGYYEDNKEYYNKTKDEDYPDDDEEWNISRNATEPLYLPNTQLRVDTKSQQSSDSDSNDNNDNNLGPSDMVRKAMMFSKNSMVLNNKTKQKLRERRRSHTFADSPRGSPRNTLSVNPKPALKVQKEAEEKEMDSDLKKRQDTFD